MRRPRVAKVLITAHPDETFFNMIESPPVVRSTRIET